MVVWGGGGGVGGGGDLQSKPSSDTFHGHVYLYLRIQGPVALTVGVLLGPVLNLSKSFQINCVKR